MHELTTSELVILLCLFTACGGCIALALEDKLPRWLTKQYCDRGFKKWLRANTRRKPE